MGGSRSGTGCLQSPHFTRGSATSWLEHRPVHEGVWGTPWGEMQTATYTSQPWIPAAGQTDGDNPQRLGWNVLASLRRGGWPAGPRTDCASPWPEREPNPTRERTGGTEVASAHLAGRPDASAHAVPCAWTALTPISSQVKV